MSAMTAQTGLFVNGSDASLRVDSSSFLSVDGDFRNLNCDPVKQVRFSGPLYLSGSLLNNDTLKFSATTGLGNGKKARIVFRTTTTYSAGATSSLSGSAIPKLWEVEIDKGTGNSLSLQTDVRSLDTVNFKTGMVYMNGRKWNLVDPVGAPSVMNHPFLKNERYGSQFAAASIADTGLVIYKTIYNYSLDINPANIGVRILGPMDIGSDLIVKRGFKPQVNAAKGGVLRYYDLFSPGYALATNTVIVNYSYNDFSYFPVGYHSLSSLKLFVSPNTDIDWSRLPSTVQNSLVSLSGPVYDGVMTALLSDLSHTNVAVDQKSFRITVADPNCSNPPVSALTQDTLHVCTGSVVVLDAGNNSAVPNSSLKWEWNTTPPLYTQTVLASPSTTHQKFVVSLKDVRGCVTLDSIVIAPQAPYPVIKYFNHLNACSGDSVIIKDTVTISSGTFSNQWVFSDASTVNTNAQLFKRKFPGPGAYSMQLNSVSNHGCAVAASATNIIVYPPPTATFTSSFNCITKAYNFSNSSVPNHTALVISSSLWNLGQAASNTSSLTNPSQTYSASGTYTVKLTVTSSFGCRDSVENAVVVYPDNHAQFSKNNSCYGDTVYFNNTTACNTGSCSYQWFFGDGSQNNNLHAKKTYTSAGLYIAKLKILAPVGCPDSASVVVFVNPKPLTQFSISTQNLCLNNTAYFSNSSSISTGTIGSYLWNFGNNITSTVLSPSSNYSNSGVFQVTLTAVSDSGCASLATIPLTVHPQPVAQYTVSNNCQGLPSQFISSSSGSGLNYAWYYGNSTVSGTLTNAVHNYTYPLPGSYTSTLVVVDTWACSDTTVETHTVYSSPFVSLGNQIATCGASYTLDAGNPGSGYYWYPGNETSQHVVANASGIYSVVVTNSNNCTGMATVQLTLNANVTPHLGPDTTVCGQIILDAGYPGSLYAWSSGPLTQTVLASGSGSYAVQVTDQNGCVGGDTIQITVNVPANVNLGSDLNTCYPKYGYTLTPTTNGSSFLWSTGSQSPQIVVYTSGTYWIDVISPNGCADRDTLTILFLATPQVDLGADRSACGTVLLDAQNAGTSYLWSTSENSQQINPATTGLYWVTVTNTLSGCSQQDTVSLTIFPLVSVFLGNDTSLCDNSNYVLNAGNPGANYNWLSGQTTPTTAITSSGLYGVVVTSPGGCSASDYIQVTLVRAPLVDLGNYTQYLCGNNTLSLNAGTVGTVIWSGDQGTLSASPDYQPEQPGKYKLRLESSGCVTYDSVLVVATNNTIQAQFLASTIDTVNKPVQFVNLSTPAPTSQYWVFGDGLTSTDLNPVHTFVLPVDYSVTLEVTNGYCTDRITKSLSVLFRNQPRPLVQSVSRLELLEFTVYPNPGRDEINIILELNDIAPLQLRLEDVSGRLIYSREFQGGRRFMPQLTLGELAGGVYLLTIESNSQKGNIRKIKKFIKAD